MRAASSADRPSAVAPTGAVRRVAFFGGAFDPPHHGHQAVCLYLLAVAGLDQVWWVPTPVHAFGKSTAPYQARVDMCRLAVRHFHPEAVRVSTVERDLPAPQHTVDTVTHLVAAHPDLRFAVAIGSDNLTELERWKDIDRLRQLADFAVVPRPGAVAADSPALLPAISSSGVRHALQQGADDLPGLDAEVLGFIRQRGLYGSGGGQA